MISIKIDKEVPKIRSRGTTSTRSISGEAPTASRRAAQTYFSARVSRTRRRPGGAAAPVIRGPVPLRPPARPPEQRHWPRGWNHVLDGWSLQGWLSPRRSGPSSPSRDPPAVQEHRPDRPQRFLSARRCEELKSKLKLTDTDLALGGLRIVTTIDRQVQDAAPSAIQNGGADRPRHRHSSTSAPAAVAPGNGAIRAMYGGPKYGPRPRLLQHGRPMRGCRPGRRSRCGR